MVGFLVDAIKLYNYNVLYVHHARIKAMYCNHLHLHYKQLLNPGMQTMELITSDEKCQKLGI